VANQHVFEEHSYELPMRWADLDSLNHVNNVVYLDYAAESRAILIEDGIVGADERVQRIAVDFLRPLLLSMRPVRVTSTREGDELIQEITSGDTDTVFARVTTVFGPPVDVERGTATFEPFLLRLRRSDVDATGVASLTQAFEFFQEARIILFSSLRTDGSGASRFVVGHVDITFGEPIPWRREPYPVTSWISRIGDSSIHIEAEIAEEGRLYAHARSVLVGFDMAAQTSRKLEDHEKKLLSEFIPER
jgi:acyl-CoA thioester hydrolase